MAVQNSVDGVYYNTLFAGNHLKTFQPLIEYSVFFYRGFTIEDFAKRDPVPQKRPPQRFLGCLELQFGNSARLGQSYSGKN